MGFINWVINSCYSGADHFIKLRKDRAAGAGYGSRAAWRDIGGPGMLVFTVKAPFIDRVAKTCDLKRAGSGFPATAGDHQR